MEKELRIIISGGGTGGHIFPAISIANAIKSKNPEAKILFVGAEDRMEMQRVPAAGYEIKGLPICGFDRKNLLKNVKVLYKIWKSQRLARSIIKDFRPMAAVGVGGYASGPTLNKCAAMGIPCLIQEQNSYAGVTNKLLAKKAEKICVAYENMDRFFPAEKIIMTGNPVRQSLLETTISHEEAIKQFGLDPKKKTILIVGGSLGARTVNESVLQHLDEIENSGVQVIWQTGKYYHESILEKLKSHHELPMLKVMDFMAKFMVKRTTEYSHFSFEEIPEKSFKFKGLERTLPDAMMKDEVFWEDYRSNPLSETESNMDQLVSQLEKVKGFKAVLWVAKAFLENFVETNTDPHKPSKVDYGPVNTTFSQNFVDGFRLRASAQTTAALHPHLFLKGYLAYGFKDRRFKGQAEFTYSFLPKAFLPREFPVHNLTFSYGSDVMAPSDKFLATDKDNVFATMKWTTVDHMMYYRTLRLLYDREWENNLRIRLQLRREVDEPTAALFYQPLDGLGAPTQDPALWKRTLTTTDLTLSFEYQPGARWINTKQRRYKPNGDNPVFFVSHTMGLRGFMGGEYAYHLSEASFSKRFWMRSWGKIDAEFKVGAQWSRVPFPLLIMPAANTSYIMQNGTFNLIDNMEFLNDRYASALIGWDMNGKIFNRIPLLKHLKWREHIGCNILWGSLRVYRIQRDVRKTHRQEQSFPPEERRRQQALLLPRTFPGERGVSLPEWSHGQQDSLYRGVCWSV